MKCQHNSGGTAINISNMFKNRACVIRTVLLQSVGSLDLIRESAVWTAGFAVSLPIFA